MQSMKRGHRKVSLFINSSKSELKFEIWIKQKMLVCELNSRDHSRLPTCIHTNTINYLELSWIFNISLKKKSNTENV